MRISEFQRKKICEAVVLQFGDQSRLYLFGSRTDDGKRGGDIDILVETQCPEEDLFMKRIKAIASIQRAIGDQKIDLVVSRCVKEDSRRVVQEALKTGILL